MPAMLLNSPHQPTTRSSNLQPGLLQHWYGVRGQVSHAEDAHVHVQACPGLADAIERGVLQGPALLDVLAPHCDRIRAANVDTVVLGCTHVLSTGATGTMQLLLGQCPGLDHIEVEVLTIIRSTLPG